ncbi:MAG TPA: efflux transporter outer membrane subunit [Steroidobacteraceae bacterium]|nr:efflux transporter outer membrane subunit [Steroidobacteraceae bacterium]
MNVFGRLLVGLGTLLIAGCAVGPEYQRPQFDVAPRYKEEDGWKPSEPNDVLDRGAWWEIYGDPVLSGLEQQADVSNENVKAAAAAVAQAQAAVREAQAGFWPTLAAGISHQWELSAVWNLDIWGQIRRSTQSNRANAQASEAALAAARLSVQSQLASTYFQLRTQDRLQTLLNDTVAAQEESLRIAENRYRFGVVAKADVVTAQTQLLNSQSQQTNVVIQRSLLEHALAVLIGKQPAEFSLQAAPMPVDVPTVPLGLPSTLLERRPDIAEAERKVAAASAQIGVARAAFFPSLSINGSYEQKIDAFGKLSNTSNRVWAFGPALAQTLFAGGLHRAQAAEARAAFDASVDNYRQTVLSGFQQVEDELVTLRVLEQQSGIVNAAVAAATQAEALTLNQYKAGTVPYSSVITAQTTRLNSEVTALTVLMNRLTASVTMVEALGGGWNAAQLQPSADGH